MSFGPAAASTDPRFRRPADTDACPCGDGVPFGECCAPRHRGTPADTPEQLMRSRYSAFVVGDARYLAQTWHPRTRPDDLALDPDQTWTGLEIAESSAGEREGTVRFRAHWQHGAERGTLAETSRFRRISGRWYYLDGQIE